MIPYTVSNVSREVLKIQKVLYGEAHITFTFLFFVLFYTSEAFHTNTAGSCDALLHTAGEPWTKNPFLLALIQG